MVMVNISQQYFIDFKNILDALKECYNNVKDKIKLKLNNKSNNEIDEYFNVKLNAIAKNLESIPHCENEFDDFLQIRSFALYIINRNFENPDFDHLDDLIYLFNIFKSIIEEKFALFKDFNKENLKNYNDKYLKFNKKLSSYDEYFIEQVYESNHYYKKDVEALSKILGEE